MRSGRVESSERVGGEILRKLEAIREKRRAVQASFIFCLSLFLRIYIRPLVWHKHEKDIRTTPLSM